MEADDCIVVFDGVCNFCSGAVRFTLEHDRHGRLRFARMQSELGRSLLSRHGIDPENAESFLVIKAGKPYLRSDAALEIARHLGPWRLLRVLRLLPKTLRDGLYSWVARNRYRWFGQRETCFAPNEKQRARFLDAS